MPIAKSTEPSPTLTQPVLSPTQAPTGMANYEWQGIPVDVCRHFQVELGTIPTKDLEQLKEITEWAKSKTSDEPSIGNILQQISKIQRELGAPRLNERAYQKVHQFIKLQRVIDETRKRQDSLRSSQWI